MDEQEKELEEILRMFDKTPSSERNNQIQMRQNNLQSRQVSQNPIDAERTVLLTLRPSQVQVLFYINNKKQIPKMVSAFYGRGERTLDL